MEAQVSSAGGESATVTESQIQSAMLARVPHFKELADSLTFEGVRRLLEKDLGLETHALDVHKKFVKKCLTENLDQDGGDTGPTGKREVEDSTEKELPKTDAKEDSFKDGDIMDDSPVMGLLTGEKKAKVQAKDTKDIEKKGLPTESTVKDALWKRAKYLKAKSSEITMAGVRKLLEEDLELEKNTLIPFKKFISEQVDLLLNPPKASKSTSSAKKDSNKSSRGKSSKNKSSEESGDSSGSESEEDAKARKKVATKRKVSEEPKKRKAPVTESKAPNKKRMKVVEKNSDSEAGGESEDDVSPSSNEKSVKKKEVALPSYGKRVERLKSVIKSCGMIVPPVIYKKAKQVPEDEREAFVRKELEEILSREGLSTDPSEKEIKDVKKRKERAKELEGIDMSNIVSSTRRRSSATTFIPPPRPKVTVETKDDDVEDKSNDEGGDSEEGSEGGDSEEGSEEGDDSQSEEVNEESDEADSD